MIKRCSNCGNNYNDQTIRKCPICFKFRPKKKKDKLGIKSFVLADTRDKKRTSTGYSHRIKTGGGAI